MRRRTVCLGLMALPLAGLSAPAVPRAQESGRGPDMAAAFVESAIDRVILPCYRRFETATAEFAATAEDGCTDLAALRAGYHAAMDAWQMVQAIRFGPVTREERHFRIQFWPDKRNLTARHLAAFLEDADPEAATPERLAAYSIAVQGFPALERLLFEDADALSAGGADAAYRCRLVGAIARNLATIAENIVAEWDAERALMLSPGPDNAAYRDGKEGLRAIHGVLSSGLDAVVMRKIAPVLGDGPEAMRPRLAESWRAERSLRNITLNLTAANRLYTADGAVPYSFDRFLRANELARLADRIARGLTDSAERARETGPDFARVIDTPGGYTDLLLLRDQADGARTAVGTDLAAALGLTMGFNALDGD